MLAPASASAEKDQPLSHPISRLIPELLSSIFLQGYYASSNYHYGSIRSRGMPLIYLQVCRHWTAVALATSELWSFLSYTLTPLDENANNNAMMVNRWLARAKACPLSLTLRSSPSFRGHYHPVLETFMAYSLQWQHIEFTLPVSIFPTLDTLKGSLPLLQTLQFAPHPTGASLQKLHAFEFAPSLRALTLAPTIHPHMIDIPWAQLTRCSTYVGTDHVDIFGYLTNITKLTLTFGQCISSHTLFKKPMSFPFLRTLSITCYRVSDPAPFLDRLIVPSLFDINLRRNADHASSWAPQIFPSISRWASTVRRITLCNAHLTDDELVRCVRETPLLEKLEIDEEERSNYVSNDFMRLLQLGPDPSSCLAPKLQYIGFKGFYYLFDDNVFVDMVESRWRAQFVAGDTAHQVARLKAVMLRPERVLDRQAAKRLDKLREEGLRVDLDWKRPFE